MGGVLKREWAVLSELRGGKLYCASQGGSISCLLWGEPGRRFGVGHSKTGMGRYFGIWHRGNGIALRGFEASATCCGVNLAAGFGVGHSKMGMGRYFGIWHRGNGVALRGFEASATCCGVNLAAGLGWGIPKREWGGTLELRAEKIVLRFELRRRLLLAVG